MDSEFVKTCHEHVNPRVFSRNNMQEIFSRFPHFPLRIQISDPGNSMIILNEIIYLENNLLIFQLISVTLMDF